MLDGQLFSSGDLAVHLIPAQRAPLAWRVRNALRWPYLWGRLCAWLAGYFTRITGVPTMVGELAIRRRTVDGAWINYGPVAYRLVTDAAVAYLVDDMDNGSGGADISLFNFHGCGTGTNAEAAGDTALQTESTTALNPDNTRATGTRSQPAANQYRSTGTLTFDAGAAVTEHGLFNQEATGGGTLFDRSVFSVINAGAGESIQFQYTHTVNSGG